MSHPRGLAVLYTYVKTADHARLARLAEREHETMAQLIRDCIESYLEEIGEPPLMPLGKPGRPRLDALRGDREAEALAVGCVESE